ncbi:MAG: hypothetical protein AAF434_17270 [Pseudomonadota bacterium]
MQDTESKETEHLYGVNFQHLFLKLEVRDKREDLSIAEEALAEYEEKYNLVGL